MKLFAKKRGAVTVFLTLILVPVLSLSTLLMEIGRYRSAKALLDEMNISASYSTLAHYNTELLTRFGLLALDADADQSVYMDYFNTNANLNEDDTYTASRLFSDVTVELEPIYSLGNMDMLKNQILYFEEYRSMITVFENRVDLNKMTEFIEKNLKMGEAGTTFKMINSSADAAASAGEWGTATNAMNDAAMALNTSVAEADTARTDLQSAIDAKVSFMEANDPDTMEDEELEDYYDELDRLSEAIDTAAETYSTALESVKSNMETYEDAYKAFQEKSLALQEKYAKMIGENTDSADFKSFGKAYENINGKLDEVLPVYDAYQQRVSAMLSGLETNKTNVDAISGSSVNEDSDYDLSASDYYTDISGYMTVDTVEELCAAMMGEGATDSVLALVNAFAVLFPYLIPGSERIDDAYNIQLTSGVAGASYTSNTTTEAELSGDDAAYIQSLLNETLETASRLGYDISKFETSGRITASTNYVFAEELLNRIIENIKTLISFVVNVIGTLTKGITAVVYVFTLLPQLGEAVAALVQLCTDIPTACANMQSMLDAMLHNLAEGFYVNSYATSMFPDRVSAETGKSFRGDRYSSIYSSAHSADEYMNEAVGAFDGLIAAWAGTGAPTESGEMFNGACVEYIVNGSPNETENQAAVYDIIFIMRLLTNILPVIGNAEIVQTSAIAGPFAPVILALWVVAESCVEMKALILSTYDKNPAKVQLVKFPYQVLLTPSNVMERGTKIADDIAKGKIKTPKEFMDQFIKPIGLASGLYSETALKDNTALSIGMEGLDAVLGVSYNEYLWVLLCTVPTLTKVQRIGDLINMEMRQSDSSFTLSDSYTYLRVNVNAKYDSLIPGLYEPLQQLDTLQLRSLRFVGY